MYKKIGDLLRGRKIPEERKIRIRNTIKRKYQNGEIILPNKCGKNNSMYGKFVYDIWLEKYGKKEAAKRQKIKNEKMSGKNNPNYGKPRTEEVKEKIRKTVLKNIENRCGQVSPRYNSDGCKLIDEYNKKHGYNFQHAENGGEVCIGGYFPDGVDEKRKTIIEIDEKHHFNPDGTYKEKDIQRQKYLENLGYKIIRIKI